MVKSASTSAIRQAYISKPGIATATIRTSATSPPNFGSTESSVPTYSGACTSGASRVDMSTSASPTVSTSQRTYWLKRSMAKGPGTATASTGATGYSGGGSCGALSSDSTRSMAELTGPVSG